MASANFCEFHREDRDPAEYQRVAEIAHSLLSYINTPEIIKRIAQVNQKGINSKEIDKCILDHVIKLGFHNEKYGLFAGYETPGLRPDYYLTLTPGRGIILEIEKGRTIENNNDILDLWKCHICSDAQYLFLIVPLEGQNSGRKDVFNKVKKRMSSFFIRKNYVGVYGLFLYGY